jgi:cytochrome c
MRTVMFAAALLVLTALPIAFAADALRGDPARGEQIYGRCLACHAIDRDRTGPRHAGLIGRRVGSVPGFNYSPALRKAGAAGMVWDEATLNKFLENPTHFLPGTRMGYAGIKDGQERADLIAYLKKAGGEKQADKGIAGLIEGHAEMDMSVTEGGSLWQRMTSDRGLTAISHYFVMDWAAVCLDVGGGLPGRL